MDFLKGRTALITGAAKRIGRACAIALAESGADIIIHYNTSQKEADALATSIQAYGIRVWTIQADFNHESDVISLYRAAHALANGIDILINSASLFTTDDLHDMTFKNITTTALINSYAPLALSRLFAEHCVYGDIINFLDTRMIDYDKKHVSYHLSKRDLFTITRIMSIEYAPNIKVNAVAPGLILPPAGEDESYLKKLEKTNLLEKAGTCADITDTVLFLLKNSFITGQVIYVDGGRHLKGQTYGI